jgi:hypothetical protein
MLRDEFNSHGGASSNVKGGQIITRSIEADLLVPYDAKSELSTMVKAISFTDVRGINIASQPD